jgi:hypothetical protein
MSGEGAGEHVRGGWRAFQIDDQGVAVNRNPAAQEIEARRRRATGSQIRDRLCRARTTRSRRPMDL